MNIFMYQIEPTFNDPTVPKISVTNFVVEEKPKTYKIIDRQCLSSKKCGEYYKNTITKDQIGKVTKTSTYSRSGKSYMMFVLEDTAENRNKFEEEVVSRVNAVIDALRADLGRYIAYCDNAKAVLSQKRW